MWSTFYLQRGILPRSSFETFSESTERTPYLMVRALFVGPRQELPARARLSKTPTRARPCCTVVEGVASTVAAEYEDSRLSRHRNDHEVAHGEFEANTADSMSWPRRCSHINQYVLVQPSPYYVHHRGRYGSWPRRLVTDLSYLQDAGGCSGCICSCHCASGSVVSWDCSIQHV